MEKSPKELLREKLEKRGAIAALGRELERRAHYKAGERTVHNWLNGEGFDAEQRETAARLLGLPSDYFEPKAAVTARESALATDDVYPSRAAFFALMGDELSPEEREELLGVSFGTGDPGVDMWQAIHRQRLRERAVQAPRENIAAGAGAGHEPPPQPKRRKR